MQCPSFNFGKDLEAKKILIICEGKHTSYYKAIFVELTDIEIIIPQGHHLHSMSMSSQSLL